MNEISEMTPETWAKFARISGSGFHSLEEIAAELQKEDTHFSGSELQIFRTFIVGRLGGEAPDWLREILSILIQGIPVQTICDPWAGIGLLVELMHEVTQAKSALAFVSKTSTAVVGKAVVENAEWYVGSPIELLSSLQSEIDVVVSVLPRDVKASHSLSMRGLDGNEVLLGNDLAEQILVTASMRLKAEGIGLFLVSPSFLNSSNSVIQHFRTLGLGLDSALALPLGTFAYHKNTPSYLVRVRKQSIPKMFVAQLSSDTSINRQVLSNLANGEEGVVLELGRYVDPLSFKGLESIRAQERFEQAEREFGAAAIPLEEFCKCINFRYGFDVQFPKHENAIYVPLNGTGTVADSLDSLNSLWAEFAVLEDVPSEMPLRYQNYAQVVIDPAISDARFVAQFLNTEFGRESRKMLGSIERDNAELDESALRRLPILVPDLSTQNAILKVEGRIAAEQNALIGLHNELRQFQRELWANPKSVKQVDQSLSVFSDRLSEGPKQYAAAGLDQWFETLPFPLASILRAWQATPTLDYKTKYEHLLHFFEATAEFVGVILLSAFGVNRALFEQQKAKLREAMQKQNLSFLRSSFGTWKCTVECVGKLTRQLLSGSDENRSLCAQIFSDSSNALPYALSRIELANILAETNKMRNDWSGHGGIVGQAEAKLRNEQLLGKVHELREVMAATWIETQLIQSLSCVLRSGVYQNEVSVLMGSNSGFLKEPRTMSTCLDVEHLYLSRKDSTRALQLLPLVYIGPSSQSASNACYFYSRTEKDGLKFISYHFIDEPERNMPESILGSLKDWWGECSMTSGKS